jgi:surface protein
MTNASQMFQNNLTFNDPDIAHWDTSTITNMYYMFSNAQAFNQDLHSWNVSNVTSMNNMFSTAIAFNQPLDTWDVGRVTDMGQMFYDAHAFNQPLNSWNVGNVTNMTLMFYRTYAFNQPLNSWNIANVAYMYAMFRENGVFNQDLSSWNTTNVTDMSSMFYVATAFNGDISTWDTANVTSMSSMFSAASAFNGNISSWDTGRVTSMGSMFGSALAFNQDISSWNVGRVTNMSYMFNSTPSFNCGQATGVAHDLMQRTATTGWQVGIVTNMDGMFQDAAAFNGDISAWCETPITTTPADFATGANASFVVGRQPTWGSCPYPNTLPPSTPTFFPLSHTATDPTYIGWQDNNPGYTFVPYLGITTPTPMTDASSMFDSNSTFNDPDVALWDTSTITDMSGMFASAAFNQPLNSWNTGSVTNMSYMFASATAFNQPLNSWNTSNVTDMSYMFTGAVAFNGDISTWDTAKVTSMNNMFASAYLFNGDISSWNVSNVTSMGSMFGSALAFNQDISSWDVSQVADMSYMFYGTPSFNCGQASGVAHDLMQRTATTGWQVGNVTNMDLMFYNADAFNGNISAWCETLITTTPSNFAAGANVNWTTDRQPTWGACPYPNGPPPPPPILYLDAGNPASYSGTGPTWFDLSGNGYDFTLINSPYWNPAGYFTLNGTDQYAELLSPASVLINWATTDYSACYWVDANSFADGSNYGAGGGLGNADANTNTQYWTFGTYNGGVLGGQPAIIYYNGAAQYGGATTYIPYTTWSQLTFVQSGGVLTYYVNGVAAGTTAIVGTPQFNSATPLTFGAQSNSYLDGSLRKLQIYNVALTADQVLQTYNAG